MKIGRISAAALAAVMMTGTAVTAFAEDAISEDFKAKVDDLAEKMAKLQAQSEAMTEKYGNDISALPEDEKIAAQTEAMEIVNKLLELIEPTIEIKDMEDTLNDAEKAYAEEKLPGIFEETTDSLPGFDIGTLTSPDPGSSDSTSDNTSDDAPAPGGSDNSDTGVGGIAVLAGTAALAGAAMIIARKRK